MSARLLVVGAPSPPGPTRRRRGSTRTARTRFYWESGDAVSQLIEPRSSSQVHPTSSGSPTTAQAQLVGLGLATPKPCWSQAVVAQRLADLWGLTGQEADRWQRIVDGSNIDQRHSVLPVEEVVGLSTKQRMESYEDHAPPLAEDAVRCALANAGINAEDVTDLIIVSCTGFSAPGLDVTLIQRLGMPLTVKRTIIGFMGCFGAIIGLRSAVSACLADPDAVVAVVCVELCSLHVRRDLSAQNQVASALFADGAAVAIVLGERIAIDHGRAGNGRLTIGHSRLIPEGRDWMTWRITDEGFAMTLSRQVPVILRQRIASYVAVVAPQRPNCYIVHPGGAGILDAVDNGLSLQGKSGLDSARTVLRRFGNMSSCTVLFVLEQVLADGYQLPGLMLAFGPGLSIESLAILPDDGG